MGVRVSVESAVGKMMLTMLAAVAELERANIKARQMAGINRAKDEGRKLGAPKRINDAEVAAWRRNNAATISATAAEFSISTAAVKRACQKFQHMDYQQLQPAS